MSQVPLTLPSHSSIFTGLYPPHHTVRDNGGFVLGKDVTTLAERLLAHGYETAGSCPPTSSIALGHRPGPRDLRRFLRLRGPRGRSLTAVERPAGATVDAALAWLRQPHRGERPFYLWVHLNDPHEPYAPPDEYRRRAPTAYAGEVMYADAQAARLLEALDALNLRRNTVVVYPPTTASRSATTARRARRLRVWRHARRAPDHRAAHRRHRLSPPWCSRAVVWEAWRASSTSRRRCSTSWGSRYRPDSTA